MDVIEHLSAVKRNELHRAIQVNFHSDSGAYSMIEESFDKAMVTQVYTLLKLIRLYI